jgi:hypothetical protein
MATAIVVELRQLASDGHASVVDILRKALVVASLLKINDFREWIEKELNGYGDSERAVVPPYRVVKGSPSAFNPYRGWIPNNNHSEKIYSHHRIREPISVIEDFSMSKNQVIAVDYSAEVQAELNKDNDSPIPFRCSRILQRTHFVGIINKVRDIVLQWALKLEEQGILGDGMTFTDADKKKAANNSSVHIENFTGQFRLNNDSTDNSTNTVNINISSALNALKDECRQIANERTRTDAVETITALEKSKTQSTALAKVGLVAGLASNGINIANSIAAHMPTIIAWITSLPP